jgi:peptidoglycan/LPS O-acetylase OafA/YrhL
MQTQDRLHSLDAVRAFALLAGIFLHASLSFFVGSDSSQSSTLLVSFFVIHTFRMVTFYLIAGFFARMMLQRRGVQGFIKNRSKRILLPMLVGWIVLVPTTIGVTIWGFIRANGADALKNVTQAPMAFPLMHLWFLYYLVMFYLLVLAVRWLFEAQIDRKGGIRAMIDRALRSVMNVYLLPILLAVPICAALYFDKSFQVWTGIPSPDAGLMPKPLPFLGFFLAFGLGWLLHRQIDLVTGLEKKWHINLALAIALSLSCLYTFGIRPDILSISAVTPEAIAKPGSIRLAHTVLYALSIWYWVFAIVGVAMRFMSGLSPMRRYIADSSYWLYLIHLPIVVFLQVVMAKWDLHWTVKFPLLLGITIAIGLVTYRYMVRYTFIGAILNGKRFPRPDRGSRAGTTPRLADQRS